MQRVNAAMRLDGPKNIRELGGYPTLDGRRTKYGQFLRGDNPYRLSAADCDTLYRYGVRLEVDLRTAYEIAKAPSPLQGYRDIAYHNIPMLDNVSSNAGDAPLPEDMGEVYIGLMDNEKAKFAEVFRLFLQYPDDCVLFNCTGGKDRTGTTAMLLLKAANCPEELIVADYAATYENVREEMERVIEKYSGMGIAINEALMRSDPETMERALLHFNNTYGSMDIWLAQAGLQEEEVAALRRKLVG